MTKVGILVLFLFLSGFLAAQNRIVDDVKHLYENGFYKEAWQLSMYARDSLNEISDELVFLQIKSAFFSRDFHFVIKSTYNGSQQNHFAILRNLSVLYSDSLNAPRLSDLPCIVNGADYEYCVLVQSVANSIINGDSLQAFSYSEIDLKHIHDTINVLITKYKGDKKKSKGYAVFLSSLISGSGKVYLGKTGEGISLFLTTAVLGLSSLEQFNLRGSSAAFFTLLGLSAITHIAGVIGTSKSYDIVEIEKYEDYKAAILFHLAKPIYRLK